MADADVIIVGAGAAGCILAARLSEDSRRRVILIEAGPDTPPGEEPEDILDAYPVAYSNPAYFWPDLLASGRHGAQPGLFPQARVMGGGSSVMGMWALRGRPDDYNAWRDQGAAGWGWDDVLPAFRRLETDADFGDAPLHGWEGPIPIRRHFPKSWPGFATAFALAASRHGLPYHDDINAEFGDGVFPVPVTTAGGERVSAAKAYLTAEVRRRPNLKIIPGATATVIPTVDGRAMGVTLRYKDGETGVIAANEIVLAAGAIHSPALLLRSGIGPADELKALGITPLADLPVGRNLQNHCVLNLAMPIIASARQSRSLKTYGLATARVSSGAEGAPRGDLLLQLIARTSPHAHGDRLGIVGTALYAPASRGSVTLAKNDADASPRIDFNLLSAPSDVARLTRGILLALTILSEPEMRVVRGPVAAVVPTSMVRRLNRPGAMNELASSLLAIAFDAPAPIRDLVLAQAGKVLPNDLKAMPPQDLLPYVTPIFHPAGTCAMGAANDPAAVVDPLCRVRGVDGLSVVDASIMPVIPTGNTCIPAMMVAEHAAPIIAART